MNFTDFLEKQGELKSEGWKAGLLDTPCTEYPDHHSHLRLRLQPPGEKEWLTPLQAVGRLVFNNENLAHRYFNYKDSAISLHGIEMACDYIDWHQNGYRPYVEARFALLEIWSISMTQILKRAPQPREFNQGEK